MTPATAGGQHLLASRLEIRPDARPLRYVDYWGTQVHAFDVHVPHTELMVTATSVVETAGPADAAGRRLGHAGRPGGPGPVRRAARPRPGTSWPSRSWTRSAGRCARRVAARRPARAAATGCTRRCDYVRGRDPVAHHLGRGPRRRPGRLPGLLPPRAGAAARGRAAGPVRLRLPAPRPDAEVGEPCRREPRLGGVLGRGLARRSTRPTCPRWPSGTCWSPAAGTTPTCGRWPASTRGRPAQSLGVTVELTRLR